MNKPLHPIIADHLRRRLAFLEVEAEAVGIGCLRANEPLGSPADRLWSELLLAKSDLEAELAAIEAAETIETKTEEKQEYET